MLSCTHTCVRIDLLFVRKMDGESIFIWVFDCYTILAYELPIFKVMGRRCNHKNTSVSCSVFALDIVRTLLCLEVNIKYQLFQKDCGAVDELRIVLERSK